MRFKRVLITGGCGFLGQYLTRDLLNEFPDLKIKILDLRPNPNRIFDFSGQHNVETITGKDICNYDSIVGEFADIDLVIHLAGVVSFSLKDRDLLEKVNVHGTTNVLKATIANNIDRLIHISSVAALGYADDEKNPVDETFRFDWNIAQRRRKYYMLTKHLADLEVRKQVRAGLAALILYPGLMFGPGDVTNSARLIRALKQGKIPFNMPGGTNIVDVRDVSGGILAALRAGVSTGDYLLAGHNLTFKEINATIAAALSVQPPQLTIPRFLKHALYGAALCAELIAQKRLELTADNVDSAFKFRYFDRSKAERQLRWQPRIPFEQTVADTIEWMDRTGQW